MAPVLPRRTLDASLWFESDAARSQLSRRAIIVLGVNPAVLAVSISLAVLLLIVVIFLRSRRFRRARAMQQIARQQEAASVPPQVSHEVLNSPPPYVPLQPLTPAYKPMDGDVELPADTERHVRNQEQGRSMSNV